MSVSLVTPTQHSRLECLHVLRDMINEQTFFDEIKEWIIVDGSKTVEKITQNDINKLQNGFKIPIIFGEFKEDCITIGKLRNRTNELTTGKIIVCLDDDDYYPPERVEEAYTNLIISNKLIAGCNSTYFYDFCLDKEFKFVTAIGFGENHTHNNAMAYKREYLINHKYDETKTFAEEASFTNDFKEPLEYLNPDKTVVISSHMTNTYNKRANILQYYTSGSPTVMETRFKILPDKYREKMSKIFIKTTKSKYDIVYFCGLCPAYKNWDPRDESLGGSEQAVKYLTANFAAMGLKVAVYGNVVEMNYANVDYIDWLKFPYHEEFNNIIVWRLLGLAYISIKQIKARKILFDLHDNMKYINMGEFYNKFIRYNFKFDYIMFKSNYHEADFKSAYQLNGAESVIIPNGLRIPEMINIVSKSTIEREPYRFCYCSCYKRGLEYILRWLWPEIIKSEPRAELHVYYGMDNMEDPKYKSMMYELISSTKNVMNHGRQSLEIVTEERLKSTFQLYVTNSVNEIDCISIREAIFCGCIPLLSNNNVFKEREGVKFDIENPIDNKEETVRKFADNLSKVGIFISKLMKDKNNVDNLRKNLNNSKLIFDWRSVANTWLKYLYINPNNNNISYKQIEDKKIEPKIVEVVEEKKNVEVVEEKKNVEVEKKNLEVVDVKKVEEEVKKSKKHRRVKNTKN